MNDRLITQVYFKSYSEWRSFLERLNDEDAHLFYSLLVKKIFEVTE